MRWLWLSGGIAAGTLGLLAIEACEDAQNAPVVASSGEAVIGGEVVDSCAWPTTIGVNAWGSCTGTLIHPRVITTAAHCLTGPTAQIFFGASRTAPGSFSLIGRCRAGAQNGVGIGTSRDWGYCVLPQDDRVERLPITPPLVGCEADRYLKPGTPAWVVGFGTTGPDRASAGIKRQVQVKINAVNRFGPGTIEVGDAAAGACYGDSGGPVYMKVADATHDWGYRVLGSTTSGSSQLCNCNCSAVFVNIAQHVHEIETVEGIDVTPCTDAEGRWAPSDACKAFPSAPQEGTGFFPLCNLARTRDAIQSCAGPDPAAAAAAVGGSGGASAADSRVLAVSGAAGAVVDQGAAALRDAIARTTAILHTLSEVNAKPPPAGAPPSGAAAAGAPGASGFDRQPDVHGEPAVAAAANRGASGTGAQAAADQPGLAGGMVIPGIEVATIRRSAGCEVRALGVSDNERFFAGWLAAGFGTLWWRRARRRRGW